MNVTQVTLPRVGETLVLGETCLHVLVVAVQEILLKDVAAVSLPLFLIKPL